MVAGDRRNLSVVRIICYGADEAVVRARLQSDLSAASGEVKVTGGEARYGQARVDNRDHRAGWLVPRRVVVEQRVRSPRTDSTVIDLQYFTY